MITEQVKHSLTTKDENHGDNRDDRSNEDPSDDSLAALVREARLFRLAFAAANRSRSRA